MFYWTLMCMLMLYFCERELSALFKNARQYDTKNTKTTKKRTTKQKLKSFGFAQVCAVSLISVDLIKFILL